MIKEIRHVQYPSQIRKVEYPSYSMTPLGSVSWGAIWGGAFVSIASLICLGLFTASFGLAHVAANVPPLISLGPGKAIWLWFCGIVSYFLGGWVTGHLTHSASAADNGVHALVAWAIATVGLAIMVAGGTLGLATSSLGISQNGVFFAPTLQGGLLSFFAFIVLVCEGIAAILGGMAGTRLYRPVAVDEEKAALREREMMGHM